LSAVLDSLIPVVLLVALGWAMRATGVIEERHWVGLERATYLLFFPALIVDTLSRADLASVPVLGVGASLVATILAIAAGLLVARKALHRRIGLDGPGFTSLFQGCTRWNSFVGLSLAGSLYGPRGVTLAAVAIAAMVPLLNVLAIAVLTRFAGAPALTLLGWLRTFATNPFIWSSAVGLTLNLSGVALPRAGALTVEMLGRASLAAGLIVVGAGLELRSVARPRPVHHLALAVKLILFPLLVAGFARLGEVTGPDLAVAVLVGAVPTASGAYILAKQMGGDAPLMAEILTLQTLAALATLPVMVALLAG
jgi:malonate transporter and related proteins